jgi:hypothetical protein
MDGWGQSENFLPMTINGLYSPIRSNGEGKTHCVDCRAEARKDVKHPSPCIQKWPCQVLIQFHDTKSCFGRIVNESVKLGISPSRIEASRMNQTALISP